MSDRYLFTAYEKPATALDYLPAARLFIVEPSAVRRRHKTLIETHTDELLTLKSQGLLVKKQPPFYVEDWAALARSRPRVLADAFTRSDEGETLTALINVRASVVPRWSGELVLLEEDIRGGLALGYSVVVLTATARAASALAGDLRAALCKRGRRLALKRL